MKTILFVCISALSIAAAGCGHKEAAKPTPVANPAPVMAPPPAQ